MARPQRALNARLRGLGLDSTLRAGFQIWRSLDWYFIRLLFINQKIKQPGLSPTAQATGARQQRGPSVPRHHSPHPPLLYSGGCFAHLCPLPGPCGHLNVQPWT